MARKNNAQAAQAEAYARSEAELIEAGGRRVNVRLRKPAVRALERLVKRLRVSQTEVINFVLAEAGSGKA